MNATNEANSAIRGIHQGGYSNSNNDSVVDDLVPIDQLSSNKPQLFDEPHHDQNHHSKNSSNKEIIDVVSTRPPLKVLFLTADTGGGHRASAEALAKQFVQHRPNTICDFLDIWSSDGKQPYDALVSYYKHLSDHPLQWQILYHISNTYPVEWVVEWHSTALCEEQIRHRIASYSPNLIVSVHPTMNYAPAMAIRNLAQQHQPKQVDETTTTNHINVIPKMVTVVTDLGSAHNTWFQKDVDRIYVASEALEGLALRRNRSVKRIGLPIRQEFHNALQYGSSATKLKLGLDPHRPMVLVMNGGEGNGNLREIVFQLYTGLTLTAGINKATVCVVCGRNEVLRQELQDRQWTLSRPQPHLQPRDNTTTNAGSATSWRDYFFSSSSSQLESIQPSNTEVSSALSSSTNDDSCDNNRDNNHDINIEKERDQNSKIAMHIMGFVPNIAEYMVAADVLVSKAGPGTIAEAAAVGLPILLTSYLPGQESGNVEYVIEKGFGDYRTDPVEIATKVCEWLLDTELLDDMGGKALQVGNPAAAAELVHDMLTLLEC